MRAARTPSAPAAVGGRPSCGSTPSWTGPTPTCGPSCAWRACRTAPCTTAATPPSAPSRTPCPTGSSALLFPQSISIFQTSFAPTYILLHKFRRGGGLVMYDRAQTPVGSVPDTLPNKVVNPLPSPLPPSPPPLPPHHLAIPLFSSPIFPPTLCISTLISNSGRGCPTAASTSTPPRAPAHYPP